MAKRRRKHDIKKVSKHERKSRRKSNEHHTKDYEDYEEPVQLRRLERERSKTRRNDMIVISVAIIFIISVIGGYFFYENYYKSDENGSGNGFNPTPNPSDIYKVPSYTPSAPDNPIVVIEVKDYGAIVVELYNKEVPRTVDNFLQYARMGFYNGLIFHRVIDDFMIQSGGFDPDMNEKPAALPPIELETHPSLRHVDGAIAMARKSAGGPDDPQGYNTATSQFYICDGPQANLDNQYAVFGQVIAGMEHVQSISSVDTHSEKGHNDVPVKDVIVNRIYDHIK